MPCDPILVDIEVTEENFEIDITKCAATVILPDGVLAGRGEGNGTGNIEAITVGTGLELVGTTLNVTEVSSGETSYRRHFMFMGG